MAMRSSEGADQRRVDLDDFRDVIRFIRPNADELRWREIPWQADIRDACRLATESGKPIFLWAMNGNPFGCT